MSYDDLKDIHEQQRELEIGRRECEADAFQVLRTRPTYFALKLLLGINHKPPKPEPDIIEPETGQPEETEIAQPA